MNQSVSIAIKDCCVEGVDVINRADGLRQSFLGKGTLKSSVIPILHNVNFSCKTGDRVAFIGSNGSGKSSLLKVIAGIYPIKSGQINVSGSISAIIEMGLGIEPELSGRQNIKILMLYNNIYQFYSKELERRIIDFSELGDKIDLPVKSYSSGMLARLAFSTSVVQDADILLLDEVFATGDYKFVTKSLNFMKKRMDQVPVTLLVSHQETIIREHCNRCILMKDGQVVMDGSAAEVLDLYNSGNY